MCEERIDQVVYIKSPLDSVWDALTDPEVTEQYWGGTRVESDWRVGSEIHYLHDGELTDSHTILEVDKPRRLVHTFRPLVTGFRDEAPSRVAFTMEQSGEVTRLTLAQDEFPVGSKVYLACSQGWPMVLSSLKTLLETGTALPTLQFDR